MGFVDSYLTIVVLLSYKPIKLYQTQLLFYNLDRLAVSVTLLLEVTEGFLLKRAAVFTMSAVFLNVCFINPSITIVVLFI